jgi:hypothetical protein
MTIAARILFKVIGMSSPGPREAHQVAGGDRNRIAQQRSLWRNEGICSIRQIRVPL